MVVHAGTWLLLSCWVLGTAAHGSHEVRGHDEIECSTESDLSDADLQAIHGPDYYRRCLQTLGPDRLSRALQSVSTGRVAHAELMRRSCASSLPRDRPR